MSTASLSTIPASAAQLQARARRLRAGAGALHPLVAEAYRRRAAELDVEALLEAVWNPAIDVGGPPATDGPEGVPAPPVLHLAVA
jgi:hypothetical protein